MCKPLAVLITAFRDNLDVKINLIKKDFFFKITLRLEKCGNVYHFFSFLDLVNMKND